MSFHQDVETALGTLVDLVNTLPQCGGAELLADTTAVETFLERLTPRSTTITDSEANALRRLRGPLLEIVDTASDERAAELLNRLLAAHPVRPSLTAHGALRWHLHYRPTGTGLADQLAVDCAIALAHVLMHDARERLTRCAAPDCARVLVDLSRNRSKRYCDARTCGNRLHVAAYRERRRSSSRR
jgi:predicted RNA-binding Zn ribbon-like protein